MTDPATITGGPSDKAVEALSLEVLTMSCERGCGAEFDVREVWARLTEDERLAHGASARRVLAAAHAVDEPRIRADERQRTVREVAEWMEGLSRWPGRAFLIAELARKFGASA